MLLHPGIVTPGLPRRSLPAFDVEGQPSSLILVDALPPVNALPSRYAMACSFNQCEGMSIMTTHQTIPYKIYGFILYPLIHRSTYLG